MEYPHQKRTIRSEYIRALGIGPYGAMQTQQLFLFVALQYFHASPMAKGMVAGALGIGMLLNPMVMFIVNRLNIPLPKAAGSAIITAALLFIPAALVDNINVFIPCIITAVALFACLPTLITGYWQTNVRAEIRGRNFSKINFLQSVSSLGSGAVIAGLLGGAENYPYVLLAAALFLLPSGIAAYTIPSPPPQGSRIPYSSLKLLWKDPLFSYMCFAWFILGFANLASIPLRIEYIASGDYGIKYAPWLVLTLTQLIPQTSNLLSTMVWGRVFDRFHFIGVRLALNCCFLSSILLFFHQSIYLQIASALFMGVANGGGSVVWSLWVTKIAPGNQTTDYMMVHVFFCGLRAVTGPLLAYHFLAGLSISTMGHIGAGLLILSTLMFIPLFWNKRFAIKNHQ